MNAAAGDAGPVPAAKKSLAAKSPAPAPALGGEPSRFGDLKSIGEVAELLGTTTRTLRYYEELGLISSSRSTETSQRRYGPEEIERLGRIRELQTLLGLELDEIAAQLAATDRLDGLRSEYLAGPPPERRDEIILEGLGILEQLRAKVSERQERLEAFAAELEARTGRYRAALAEAKGSAAAAPAPPSAPETPPPRASPAQQKRQGLAALR